MSALKIPRSPNPIALAVVATKEPPIFNEASRPKIIPEGLIKNRLAVPLARIIPSILDTDPPVTRLIMFAISAALLKKAVPPVGTENCWKL